MLHPGWAGARKQACSPSTALLHCHSSPLPQELLDWFTGTTASPLQQAQQAQQQQAPARQRAAGAAQQQQQLGAPASLPLPEFGSRRLTRSLSKNNSGGSSLSDEQKELLVKLMSRGLEARTSAEEAAAGGGFSAALSGFPAALSGLGSAAGSLSRRFDPMKRTRSSGAGLRSNDMERAAAQLVQQAGLAAQAAAQAAAAQAAAGPSAREAAPAGGAAAAAIGFRGFPKLNSGGGSGSGVGQHSLTRAISKRRASGTGGGAAAGPATGPPSIPLLEPSPLDRGFSDVLVTPAFSSNEIRLLLEALNPPK